MTPAASSPGAKANELQRSASIAVPSADVDLSSSRDTQILKKRMRCAAADSRRLTDHRPIDFEPHVVQDRDLISGPNLRSDHPIAEKIVRALAGAAVAPDAFRQGPDRALDRWR